MNFIQTDKVMVWTNFAEGNVTKFQAGQQVSSESFQIWPSWHTLKIVQPKNVLEAGKLGLPAGPKPFWKLTIYLGPAQSLEFNQDGPASRQIAYVLILDLDFF